MYRYINSSKIVIFMQSAHIWNILDAFYKHIPPCICYENAETLANLPLYWRYYFQGLWGLWFSPTYFISARGGDFDVRSDHLSEIYQCVSHGG